MKKIRLVGLKGNRIELSYLNSIKGKNIYLLLSLIALIIVSPFFEHGILQSKFMMALLSIVLLLGVFAVNYDKRHFFTSLILMIPAIIINWINLFFDMPTLVIFFYITTILFYAYMAIIILSHVLKAKEITHDILFGAICVYLLIGLTWGTLFSIIEYLRPGSFYTDPTINIDNLVNWSDLVYFSFVTLTTAGYGDIKPVTSHARSLSIIEVIIGVMYTAILIARLVSLYSMEIRTNSKYSKNNISL